MLADIYPLAVMQEFTEPSLPLLPPFRSSEVERDLILSGRFGVSPCVKKGHPPPYTGGWRLTLEEQNHRNGINFFSFY